MFKFSDKLCVLCYNFVLHLHYFQLDVEQEKALKIKTIGKQKKKNLSNIMHLIHDKYDQITIASINVYNKITITKNFRTYILNNDDFILKSFETYHSTININQNVTNIYNELKNNTIKIGQNIYQIYKILSIETTKHEIIQEVVVKQIQQAIIDEKTKLLQIEMSQNLCLLNAKQILHRIRVVHCCKFSPQFYQNLYGIKNIQRYNRFCELVNKDYTIKHDYRNQFYFVSPFIKPNTSLLYHMLPMYSIDILTNQLY